MILKGILVMLIAVGCGSKSGSVGTRETQNDPSNSSNQNTFSVETVDSLPTCNSDRQSQMFYVEEDFKWYKCDNDDWEASIQYSFVVDVLNVDIPTTDFSELEDDTFRSTGGTLTKYSDGSVVLFMSFISIYSLDDFDTDMYSFSILIPNGVTYTVRAGVAVYVNDAWRQPFINYDGTTVKLTAEDEENSILLHTFSFTSIMQ